MNPWTRKEILQVASVLSLKTTDRTHINDLFDRLGPIPRLCIKYLLYHPCGLVQYEDDVDRAISNITPGQFEHLVQNAASLTMDMVSEKICLLSRKEREDIHSSAIISTITPSMQSRLASQFRNLELDEQLHLYRRLESVPALRATADIPFEAYAQRRIQEGIVLNVVPMVELEKREKSGSANGGKK